MNEGGCRLFVGELSEHCVEEDLLNLFSPYGMVLDVAINRNADLYGSTVAQAFVCFSDQSEAYNAMRTLNGEIFLGQRLRIRWAAQTPVGGGTVLPAARKRPSVINSVYIYYTSPETSFYLAEGDLWPAFEPFGNVTEISIKQSKMDNQSYRQTGYGFVHFSSDEAGVASALRSVQELNGETVNGIRFTVEPSRNLLKQFNSPAPPPAALPAYSPHAYPHALAPPQVPFVPYGAYPTRLGAAGGGGVSSGGYQGYAPTKNSMGGGVRDGGGGGGATIASYQQQRVGNQVIGLAGPMHGVAPLAAYQGSTGAAGSFPTRQFENINNIGRNVNMNRDPLPFHGRAVGAGAATGGGGDVDRPHFQHHYSPHTQQQQQQYAPRVHQGFAQILPAAGAPNGARDGAGAFRMPPSTAFSSFPLSAAEQQQQQQQQVLRQANQAHVRGLVNHQEATLGTEENENENNNNFWGIRNSLSSSISDTTPSHSQSQSQPRSPPSFSIPPTYPVAGPAPTGYSAVRGTMPGAVYGGELAWKSAWNPAFGGAAASTGSFSSNVAAARSAEGAAVQQSSERVSPLFGGYIDACLEQRPAGSLIAALGGESSRSRLQSEGEEDCELGSEGSTSAPPTSVGSPTLSLYSNPRSLPASAAAVSVAQTKSFLSLGKKTMMPNMEAVPWLSLGNVEDLGMQDLCNDMASSVFITPRM